MILILLAVVCLASVPLTGGRLGRLASVEIRALWAAPLALALQLVILGFARGGSHSLHVAVHLFTYGLAALFLWANRRLPGMAVLGVGAAANTLAILLNGGIMPASAWARRVAGLRLTPGFHNSLALAHPHLLWLGDIIPVPAPGILRNVFSAGDLLIFAGMLVLLHCTCRDRSTGEGADGGEKAVTAVPRRASHTQLPAA